MLKVVNSLGWGIVYSNNYITFVLQERILTIKHEYMEFRGLEMKDKCIYFVNLCEGGSAVYQFKDCLDYERPTQYYYRLF